MQKYPVRPSHRANLTPANLERIVRTHFAEATSSGDAVTASFGALELLKVRAEGRELGVEVTMNPKVAIDVASDTIRRYNQFLEEATGYSSKERAKRLKKSAAASSTPG